MQSPDYEDYSIGTNLNCDLNLFTHDKDHDLFHATMSTLGIPSVKDMPDMITLISNITGGSISFLYDHAKYADNGDVEFVRYSATNITPNTNYYVHVIVAE